MATCNAELYMDSATARGMTNQTKPDKREFESALHPCVLKSTVHTHANKAKHDTVHYAYQIQLDTHQKVLQFECFSFNCTTTSRLSAVASSAKVLRVMLWSPLSTRVIKAGFLPTSSASSDLPICCSWIAW